MARAEADVLPKSLFSGCVGAKRGSVVAGFEQVLTCVKVRVLFHAKTRLLP